jgi:proteasome assembly chaperone (PAC2) family protein
MSKLITFSIRPKLKDPCLVAAWPGMGSVAMVAVNYLKDKLGAQPLGEMAQADFFTPTGALVSKQLIQPPEPPQNRFFYCRSNTSFGDLIIFIGSVQPIPHREYEFATEILNGAKMFGIQTVYTTAAAPSDMHFKSTPRIFAVPNHKDLLKKLAEYKVHFMGEGNIAGMNGLLVSVAGEMGIPGVCLLGEIPFFTAQIEFPKASFMVLEILSKLLRIDIDMVDLELYANRKEKEIEPLASLLSKGKPSAETSPTDREIVPEPEEKVPRSVQLKIEKLFQQAEFDRTYKSKMRLKEELDKWGLFDDYLDRFLDLFKKDQDKS